MAKRAWAVLGAFVGPVFAFGCNLVVGAGDYSVGGDGGSAASGSPESSGGLAGSGVGGGSGRTSSSGALAGSGTTAGSGTPASSGSGPATCGSSIPSNSASFQQLVNACILAVSCDPDEFPVSVSDCISEDYLAAYASLSCLSSIKTCDDYYNCTGSRVATPTECTGLNADDTGTCTGQVGITCFGSSFFGRVDNCAKIGGTCEAYQEDAFGDVATGCEVAPSCSNTDTDYHCSGNNIYSCINGVGYGEDCADINATCDTSGTDTSCYFNSPTCPTVGTTCDGNVLNLCVGAGSSTALIQYNCGASGLTCDPSDGGQCIDPACPSSNCTEECSNDGSSVIACVGGTALTINCSVVGASGTFSSCDTLTDGNTYCE